MTLIDNLRIILFKFNLKRLKKYLEHKNSYHEAGHLIFSYLIGFPCEYIHVGFRIDFLGNSYDISSECEVKHILPKKLEHFLENNNQQSPQEIKDDVIKYLIAIVVGKLSENKFFKEYLNTKLEQFQKKYGENLMESNLNEDVTRYQFVILRYFKEKEKIDQVNILIRKIVDEYLVNDFVQRQIKLFSKLSNKYKHMDKEMIEKYIFTNDFDKFIEREQLQINKWIKSA